MKIDLFTDELWLQVCNRMGIRGPAVREVARLLCQGYRTTEVAKMRDRGVKTIESQRVLALRQTRIGHIGLFIARVHQVALDLWQQEEKR